MSNNLSKTLNITPLEEIENSESMNIQEKEKQTDYEKVHKGIEEAATVGAMAMQELAGIASASQHPRAYESLTELIKAVVSANKELLEIQKTQIDIDTKTGNTPKEEKVINNTMFVGSTQEMLEQMQKLKETKS